MRRRQFIAGLGSIAIGSAAARAQRPTQLRGIGVLANAESQDPEWLRQIAAFLDRMKRLGWEDGRDCRLEYRFAGGDPVRASEMAKDLVRLKPEVILARSTPIVRALVLETRDIPIVFVSVSDPVGDKFVASMARPGGNITGFTNVEASLGGKWLQLLKEIAPSVKRAMVLVNPDVASGGGSFYLRSINAAAASMSVAVDAVNVATVEEVERAMAALATRPDSGLVVIPDPFIVPNRALVRTLAERLRVPAVYGWPYMAFEGGLVAYGVDNVDLYRRSADYVDRILRGAQPSELPVQAPVQFGLVVNLKTAKAIGIEIPSTVLARADEVIE